MISSPCKSSTDERVIIRNRYLTESKIMAGLRELPPDPLKGCRLMVDRPQKRRTESKRLIAAALIVSVVGYLALCIADPTVLWIPPAVVTLVTAIYGRCFVLGHTSLDQLNKACEAQEQQLLSEICDVCVHPFRAADQDVLDERCEGCPVIALAQSALRKQYAFGYAQGMYDACSSVRDAYNAVNQEINKRYRRG